MCKEDVQKKYDGRGCADVKSYEMCKLMSELAPTPGICG